MGSAPLDTALGGHQSLPDDLAAKDPAVTIVLAHPAMEVLADEFEVQAFEKTLL